MSEEDRIPNDPKYADAAHVVTADYGETGSPLSWRIQEDGTLTVILPGGKKTNRPLPNGFTPEQAKVITFEDGLSKAEASTAGRALQRRGDATRRPKGKS